MNEIEWAELKLIDGDDCLIIYANGKKHTHKVTDVFERMSEPTDAARVGELERERDELRNALKSIDIYVEKWNANNLGDIHLQRKRWQRLGVVAAAALAAKGAG